MNDTNFYHQALAEFHAAAQHGAVRESDITLAQRSAILQRAQQLKDEARVAQTCHNPNHACTDGTVEPHEIGPSCMAETR